MASCFMSAVLPNGFVCTRGACPAALGEKGGRRYGVLSGAAGNGVGVRAGDAAAGDDVEAPEAAGTTDAFGTGVDDGCGNA